MIDVKNQIVESLFLVFFIYFLVLTIGSFFSFLLFFIILILSFYSSFLALRIAIPVLIFLIANQFLIQKISEDISLFGSSNVYTSGGLFYLIIFLIIKIFSKFTFDKFSLVFLIPFLASLLNSLSNISGAMLFSLNVFGGFFLLFYMLNCLLCYVNKDSVDKFKILEYDFHIIIFFIFIFSMLYMLYDYATNFSLFKYYVESIEVLRGEAEDKIDGIPRQFWTAVFNFDYVLRYTPFINDPIRSAYWCMYIFLFVISTKLLSVFSRRSIALIYLILFIMCWSKGVYISFLLITGFYFLLKNKFYKVVLFLTVLITAINIYLSTILKTSGIIHVAGLMEPFKVPVNIHYLIGNDLYQAGNMGRLEDEFWSDSVVRGAESLVGTYMYAFGLVGVVLFITMHLYVVRKMYNEKLYLLSCILLVALSVSFLQEGQYNIFQSFIIVLIMFFTIYKAKIGAK